MGTATEPLYVVQDARGEASAAAEIVNVALLLHESISKISATVVEIGRRICDDADYSRISKKLTCNNCGGKRESGEEI